MTIELFILSFVFIVKFNFSQIFKKSAREPTIEKLIPDGIMQPFGGSKLDLERVYNFLKSRCYEDERDGLEEILQNLRLATSFLRHILKK